MKMFDHHINCSAHLLYMTMPFKNSLCEFRCWNEPDVDMNMKDALRAAAENDHTEVVSCLIQRDSSLGAQIVEDLTTSKSSYTDLSLLSSIFEVAS